MNITPDTLNAFTETLLPYIAIGVAIAIAGTLSAKTLLKYIHKFVDWITGR